MSDKNKDEMLRKSVALCKKAGKSLSASEKAREELAEKMAADQQDKKAAEAYYDGILDGLIEQGILKEAERESARKGLGSHEKLAAQLRMILDRTNPVSIGTPDGDEKLPGGEKAAATLQDVDDNYRQAVGLA